MPAAAMIEIVLLNAANCRTVKLPDEFQVYKNDCDRVHYYCDYTVIDYRLSSIMLPDLIRTRNTIVQVTNVSTISKCFFCLFF